MIRVIDIGISGASGVVFGGPKRDILFVLVSKVVFNAMTFKPMETITTGSSLYKVTGLKQLLGIRVTGAAPTRFKIP